NILFLLLGGRSEVSPTPSSPRFLWKYSGDYLPVGELLFGGALIDYQRLRLQEIQWQVALKHDLTQALTRAREITTRASRARFARFCRGDAGGGRLGRRW